MLIVDANVLVAVMNRRDKHHHRMTTLLSGRNDQFLVTPYVVAEVAYLVQKFAGAAAETQFVEAVRDDAFRQVDVSDDLPRIAELVRTFSDFPLGLADASIIAVAERLRVPDVATMDTHFHAIKPRGIDYLNILP